jgi:DNA-directed RNA polymerase subunit beta
VLVAFMPWNGYNFEDSILMSERIVKDDVFTSIHIEEFEVMARDTKLGPEEITRDIPNVSEEALKNLDEAGIVYIGAEVKPGDILVGKITPKGESPMTPEEKLLRAIFGEKGLRRARHLAAVPPGREGHGRRSARLQPPRRRQGRACDGHRARGNRASGQGPRRRTGDPGPQRLWPSGRHAEGQDGHRRTEGLQEGRGKITEERLLNDYPRSQWWTFAVDDEKLMGEIEALRASSTTSPRSAGKRFMDKVEKLQRGDELPPGVMKMVKVFVAVKRKIQPGDKMAGRHGNKGVVSRIVPDEDMPFLEDGTPVDIVLNPLGVPSA